jgi:hypothetical protein
MNVLVDFIVEHGQESKPVVAVDTVKAASAVIESKPNEEVKSEENKT